MNSNKEQNLPETGCTEFIGGFVLSIALLALCCQTIYKVLSM
jgi:hypothetical protein